MRRSEAYAGGMDNLIAVATFGSHIEGDLARTALEAAGIESMLRDDEGGGQYPNLAFSEGVALLVNEEQAQAAREVLASTAVSPEPAETSASPDARRAGGAGHLSTQPYPRAERGRGQLAMACGCRSGSRRRGV